MNHRKRKSDDDVEWGKKKTKRKSKDVESLFCIIHSLTVSDHGSFTSLDDGKDTPQKKFGRLHKIKDVRLLEDVESTKQTQDVCDLIPESVEGLDTVKTGWHRGCYQRFTKNLDRLKPAVESSHPTSPEPCLAPAFSHSLWKRAPKRSLEKSHFLFPSDECLFCDKKTIKKQGKKEHLKLKPSLIGTTNPMVGKISKKQLKKCKTIATVPCFVRLLALICLQLRHIFINPVITIFTANFKHLKDIINQNQQRRKKNRNYCAKHRQVITEHKVFPLSLLRSRYINELQK